VIPNGMQAPVAVRDLSAQTAILLYLYLVKCTAVQYAVLSANIQEGLAVASIAQDDPFTLPGNDPFPRARMHHDRNAQ